MKEKMLYYIRNSANSILRGTNTIITYNELTESQFQSVKKHIAYSVNKEDIVCLISTSILEEGKTGALFTIDGVYVKSWGIMTKTYYCSYSEVAKANFGNATDINKEQMCKLMKKLEEILSDEKKKINKEKKINNIVGTIETVIDIGEKAIDLIGRFNSKIASISNEDSKMKVSKNSDQCIPKNEERMRYGFEQYQLFQNNAEKMKKIMERANHVSAENSNETTLFLADFIDGSMEMVGFLINELNKKEKKWSNLELDLKNKITDDVLTNTLEYTKWINFWGLMFHPKTAFEKYYPNEPVCGSAELFNDVIIAIDQLLYSEEYFRTVTTEFGEKVVLSFEKMTKADPNNGIEKRLYDFYLESQNYIDSFCEKLRGVYSDLKKLSEKMSEV